MHSTHGAPPAAFARPTSAHGATARRVASWPEILSDGSDLRQLSYLLRAENNRPREHAVQKQNHDARRLFADRPCASACRASRTRAGPAERGRSLCCTCMMQRAQLLLVDLLVDAGHASAGFCSMRARKTVSAVAVPPRWRGAGGAPLTLKIAAHVTAMLLMDLPAVQPRQVVT